MHNFPNAGYILTLSAIALAYTMGLWFRDIISEGKQNVYDIIKSFIVIIVSLSIIIWSLIHVLVEISLCYSLITKFVGYSPNLKSKAISPEEIDKISQLSEEELSKINLSDEQLGYYLAGLLEGDGCINIPALGNSSLNRVLNPRIIFTSNKNNLNLYIYIQRRLGGIGRFQLSNANTIRYIIGDVKGMVHIVNLIHGKLRTPKNLTFNNLIEFLNAKYNTNIPMSAYDESNLGDNAWLCGFSEADAYFGVKVLDPKPKSETRKRSSSRIVNLTYRIDQRLHDKPTSLSLSPFMEKLANYMDCNILTYTNNYNVDVLYISISSIKKLEVVIDYFNKYSLIGTKGKDFKDWEIVYNIMLSKQHLSDSGILTIKSIQSNMNRNRK